MLSSMKKIKQNKGSDRVAEEEGWNPTSGGDTRTEMLFTKTDRRRSEE